jgi:xylulokinase
LTLLGIDVGTTGVRAAVFDTHAASVRVLAEASEKGTYEALAPGWVEASAENWWEQVCAVCARLGRQASLERVEGVGVTGQAPTAILVDEDGQPLRPAILWLDVRAAAQAREVDAALGPGRARAISGNRMHAYYLGPKLAWLREREPEVLDRAALVLQSHAFVVMKLTGVASCDPSTAMLCAPLFDVRAGAWSEEGTHAAGIPKRILPPLARSHDVVGGVTSAAAAATGLREGTPVVAGGGDFASSALGAGVVEEGEACLMLGTAGNLLLPLCAPRFDDRLINSHHVGCDRWLSLGGTLCGAALEWFRRTFAPGIDWAELENEAAAVRTAGLVMLPYLQGERTPIWDESARGAFFGLDLAHGRGHMYRSLLEGVALGFRHCLAVAEDAGLVLHEAIAANGAGESALLRQTLADALGVPVTWRPGGAGAGTVRGAAILAGLGVGALAGPRVEQGKGLRHEPDPRAHAELEEIFVRRTALYESLRSPS